MGGERLAAEGTLFTEAYPQQRNLSDDFFVSLIKRRRPTALNHSLETTMPKKRQYLVNDIADFDRHFYEAYDERFLLNKAQTLMFIVKNQEPFVKFATDNGAVVDGLDAKYFDALKAEIHFTEFHQFECFFALMLALYNEDMPHWLYLTTYKNAELDSKIDAFLEGDIEKVTNGKEKNIDNFVQIAIYYDQNPTDEALRATWPENIDNAKWLIQRLAARFRKANDEYNSYKHGLRVMTGRSEFRLFPTARPDQGLRLGSENSTVFLVLKDRQEEQDVISETVYKTTRHFNPQLSVRHLEYMAALLANMKATRLASIKGEPSEFFVFNDLDKDALYGLDPMTEWTVAV